MEDKFIIIQWPDIQEWMTEEGFEDNSYLINDEKGIEKYGSSAYFVDTLWIEEVYERKKKYINYTTELVNEKFVYIPEEDIDKFVETCDEMKLTCHGGALKLNDEGIPTGKYFYI